MAQPSDLTTISVCLRNLEPALGDLLPQHSDKLVEMYTKALKNLAGQEIEGGVKRELVIELLQQLQSHPDFMERFEGEFRAVSGHRTYLQTQAMLILRDNPDIVDEVCSVVLEHTGSLDNGSERIIVLGEGGKGGATSIKAANIASTIERIGKVVVGVVSNVSLLQSNNPIFIACGVYLYLNVLKEAATYEISERDASVYWGLIIGSRTSDTMTEEKVLKHTNVERSKRELAELNLSEIRDALGSLEKIGAIELLDGTWHIVERFRIK